MEIIDNYIKNELYDALCTLHIEYNAVHWMGYSAPSDHALHELIAKTRPIGYSPKGATAWYNIRPTNPQWHNDIKSYCTTEGKFYKPVWPPLETGIFYLKSPEEGGELELRTGELIEPAVNRYVSFDCNITHRVRSYKGNRVSIGIIWWFDTPIYGDLPIDKNLTLHRQWEIEDGK